MKSAFLAAPALLALAFSPAVATAHQAGLSYGTLRLAGSRLEVALRFSAAELEASWREPGPGRWGGSLEALAAEVLGTVAVTQGEYPCASGAVEGRHEAVGAVVLSRTYRCPRDGAPIEIRYGFLALMPPGHVHLANVVVGRGTEEHVLDAQRDLLELVARTSVPRSAARFIRLGVVHIFTGWDHIAFLLGLLLAGGALREVAQVVSAFTVAHALTLALAALAVVTPPPALVEPLIAASVAYVGMENLLAAGRGRAPSGRWRVALAFGLVHGFGFAGALRELRLPGAGLATALFSFNVGVELGQGAIVAVAFPLLALFRRRRDLASVVLPLGSTAVGAMGLVWLAQRLP